MDNVTHSLFGATLGRALFPRAGRGVTAALVIASNAPDADIIMTAGGPLNYLTWHRGPTHGPLGVVVLALVTAAVVRGWLGRFERDRAAEHASFPVLGLAAAAGLVAHILMDFPTSYGTRLLSPFTWRWFATDLMPIVDVYLLVVLGGLMVFGTRRPAFRRQAATLAIAYVMANYGVRAVAHQQALAAAPRVMAPLLPAPCDGAVPPSLLSQWPVDATAAAHRERGASHCLVEVAAIPTFFSPFRWQIIARLSDSYQTMPLDVWRDTGAPEPSGQETPEPPGALGNAASVDAPWRRAQPHPDQWTPAALRAAASNTGRVFLGFSRFPATESTLAADGSATVRWSDLRFVNTPGQRPGARRGMFSARVSLAPDGTVRSEQLGE